MSSNGYQHLEFRPGTGYQQYFVKDRKFTAELIYRATVGEQASTPEEVAHDYDLPVAAVLEAIDYSRRNAELLRLERESKLARLAEFEKRYPPLMPPDLQPQS